MPMPRHLSGLKFHVQGVVPNPVCASMSAEERQVMSKVLTCSPGPMLGRYVGLTKGAPVDIAEMNEVYVMLEGETITEEYSKLHSNTQQN